MMSNRKLSTLGFVKTCIWNVVRVSDDNVAFLDYPQFEEHAFPELMNSIRVDLLEGACSERSYEHSQNRPVLHRKELLLLDGHPRRTEFAKLTRELEKLGLFYDTHIIGFKEQWEDMALHKVTVEGHSVAAEVVNSDELDIQHHRAAIVRYQLSKPVSYSFRMSF